MTTFRTNTDLNPRGRQMKKVRERAEAQVWRLIGLIPAVFTRSPLDPQKEIAKVERREAARRAVDNLLR